MYNYVVSCLAKMRVGTEFQANDHLPRNFSKHNPPSLSPPLNFVNQALVILLNLLYRNQGKMYRVHLALGGPQTFSSTYAALSPRWFPTFLKSTSSLASSGHSRPLDS